MPTIYISQNQNEIYTKAFAVDYGCNLYQCLKQEQIILDRAKCNGAGICRGCMLYIVEEGMECLACRYTVEQDLHILLSKEQAFSQSILLAKNEISSMEFSNMQISSKETSINETSIKETSSKEIASNTSTQEASIMKGHTVLFEETHSYGIAFDLGTTTIASALLDLTTGTIIAEQGCYNSQIPYGQDVIARIQYSIKNSDSNHSGLEQLHQCIVNDCTSLYHYYLSLGLIASSLTKITISGNTTMIHFLMNWSADSLGAYPFTPYSLNGISMDYNGVEIYVFPCKSAFVGGDIIAGIQYLGLGQSSSYDMLIDLGTNGEIWLLNNESGVCSSTACGPAFANSVTKGNAHGTTVIDIIADALQMGSIDSTGLLNPSEFEHGIICDEIVVTQDTIRQIQLAKAAIATGIELLAYELRLPLTDIGNIYIAGGFGFHLNLESAFTIGLLPEEFRNRIQIVGNTSLLGSIQALLDTEQSHLSIHLPKKLETSKVLDLSMNKNFQEFFIHRIHF